MYERILALKAPLNITGQIVSKTEPYLIERLTF